jgi:hypothetical protein
MVRDMQGQQKRRDARFAADEEEYVEDRPYTEPVIGNRAGRTCRTRSPGE